MPATRKTHQVTPADAGRVDLVVQAMTSLPRRQVRGLFDRGCVSVNDEPCPQTFRRVEEGDVVAVNYDPGQRYHEEAKARVDPNFTIVFEDEHLLVVDKAAHILTTPTPSQDHNTLMHRVSKHITRGRSDDAAFACHRLDRGVSGLLVVGKSAKAAALMREQFERHEPQREYVAIVAGKVEPREGTFRSYLATGENLDRFSTHDKSKGELAITHYRVERYLRDATLVRIRLETGRRNQIRVHFAEVGHPVIGDPRYGRAMAKHRDWRARRIALHARRLAFTHPVTGKKLSFDSPPPQAFVRFIGDGRGE